MIRFEAHDAKRNIHRAYEIERSADLFGWTVIRTRWGRCGSALREKTIATPSPETADRLVRAVLRKRGNARRRIGVEYREVEP
jgi:hypothetical protein